MENKFEPSEREKLVHQWKCYMDTSRGDLGKAALIKRQLEKDKPPKVEVEEVAPQEVEKQVITEAPKEAVALPIKKKRGRPPKIKK